ncbi:MAG: alpha/beta fold hydrolase [Chloroflexi bacterium]|nr:alpha/beta fold hydrolase [Chloroflexota bacterium]
MPSYRFRSEPLALDDAARASAPGQFVRLSDGWTHYELAGPPDAQTVVLVHGFSVPYYIWDPTFAALAEAGFRALRYDLYGRGFSDRPDVEYNADLYDRQLRELLDALGIAAPVDVAGLSMGGPIAIHFADRHPERVRRLVLVDPAGFPLKQPPVAALIRLYPLGEWLMDRFGEQILVKSLVKDMKHPERVPGYAERYRAQTRYAGFRRALLGTMRSGMLTGAGDAYRRVGQQERPVLLIWGREDHVVPFEASAQVLAAIPHAEFHAIDDAGHVPHLERPDVVNPILVEFLRR